MRNVIDIMIVCCFSTGFIFDFLGRIHDELFFAVDFDVREDVIVFRIVKRIGIMVFQHMLTLGKCIVHSGRIHVYLKRDFLL